MSEEGLRPLSWQELYRVLIEELPKPSEIPIELLLHPAMIRRFKTIEHEQPVGSWAGEGPGLRVLGDDSLEQHEFAIRYADGHIVKKSMRG